jgi:nitroimidazol reductase NimA-like FMN-containing flavoprotein (pyridoxamine 5'-phosphate oxidase superfamily)
MTILQQTPSLLGHTRTTTPHHAETSIIVQNATYSVQSDHETERSGTTNGCPETNVPCRPDSHPFSYPPWATSTRGPASTVPPSGQKIHQMPIDPTVYQESNVDELVLRCTYPPTQMFGELNQDQIAQVLHTEMTGHIGVYTAEQWHIVPIVYFYNGKSIYSYSIDDIHRQNLHLDPDAYIEIDQITDRSNWQRVIVRGTLKELKGNTGANALYVLMQQIMTLIAGGQWLHEMEGAAPQQTETTRRYVAVYRLQLTEKTGYGQLSVGEKLRS